MSPTGTEPTGEGRRPTPLLRPGVREAIDLELEHHLAERVDRLVDEGWPPDEARREAERRFGVRRHYVDELRQVAGAEEGRRWMMGQLETWIQDMAYAVRSLRRQPGFTAALVLTLALGIGATGAMFSVVDAVLLRPLPYAATESLVEVRPSRPDEGVVSRRVPRSQVAPWVDRADFVAEVGEHDQVSLIRTDLGFPSKVAALAVSANLDDVLGITAAMGRTFVPEDQREARKVVVLTWAYYRSMGATPDVVGSELELDDEVWTVVGVLGPGVRFPVPSMTDIWVPMGPDGAVAGHRTASVRLVARLASGVSLGAARDRADVLAAQLAEALPTENGWHVALTPVGEWRANRDVIQGLWILGGAAVMILLITMVNGTNLLLVRAQARRGEVGIRRALGASRWRITRQAVLESVLLSLAAGLVATGVAWGVVRFVATIAPRELTFGMVHEFGLEARALLLVFSVATLVGLLIGFLPGLGLSRSSLQGAGSARGADGDPKAARLRSGLVALEVAVSVVLLVGAGLFLRSFANLQQTDVGIDVDRLAVVELDLPSQRYPTAEERGAFTRQALDRLRALPGVTGASVSLGGPPDGGGLTFTNGMRAEGAESGPSDPVVPFLEATPGYLETVGVTFVAGRDITLDDAANDGVVIDRDLARSLFGGAGAVGRRFTLNGDADEVQWLTVVGVVDELMLGGPDDRTGAGAIVHAMDPDAPGSYQTYSIRTAGDPGAVLQEARNTFATLDGKLPLYTVQTARQALGESMTRPRFLVLLLSIVAWLALILASVGIYGVVSYAVRQRRREMGIRLALGASSGSVRGRVVTWGLRLALLGTAVGLGAALLLGDVAEALLFGVAPGDPVALGASAVVMVGVTLLACLLPALRATRVDVVEVLRSE